MALPHNTGIIQTSITLYGATEDYVDRSILNYQVSRLRDAILQIVPWQNLNEGIKTRSHESLKNESKS